jgi:hypothetical protein
MKVYLPNDGQVATLEHTRPTYVPDSLDDLRGPVEGVIKLPLLLDWTPSNSYDLSSPARVRRMYQTVLSEAASEDDVTRFVDRTLLAQLWDSLHLPRRVRYAWELAHPELGA